MVGVAMSRALRAWLSRRRSWRQWWSLTGMSIPELLASPDATVVLAHPPAGPPQALVILATPAGGPDRVIGAAVPQRRSSPREVVRLLLRTLAHRRNGCPAVQLWCPHALVAGFMAHGFHEADARRERYRPDRWQHGPVHLDPAAHAAGLHRLSRVPTGQ